MIALELVIKILVAMVVGFFLYKIGLFNDDMNSKLSRIVVELVCPFMIFGNITSICGLDIAPKEEVYQVMIIGVVIYAVLIPLSYLVVKILRTPNHASGIYQSLLLFGNVGFIGLPVAESLYGPVGVFYMALLNIHFNFVCYSYGLWLVSGQSGEKRTFSFKKMINPAMVTIVIALIIFLLDIRIPSVIISPFSFIGSLTSPLSMIILGASIAAQDFKTIFSKWRLYILTIFRMIFLPLITFLIMKAIFGPGIVTSIVTFYLGTPAAVITSMFAMAYGGDTETATSGTAMMNIFCILTIPGIYWMTMNL